MGGSLLIERLPKLWEGPEKLGASLKNGRFSRQKFYALICSRNLPSGK